MPGLLIGVVAERSSVSTQTIRYYESIGLLVPPHRSASGYRRYDEQTVEELTFIKKAQTLGFALDEISEILQLSRSGVTPCARVLTLAHSHLGAVDEKIRRLKSFRRQLAAEIKKWEGQTQPTCDGLCQLIAGVDPEAGGGPVEVPLPRGRRTAKAERGRPR